MTPYNVEMTSPWWYRKRALVFGCIYFAGFLAFGGGISGRSFHPAIALGFMAACIAVRIWGSAYLRASTVWNADALNDRLIMEGPFRYTRNPLYFGNVLMALAMGSLASVPGWAFIVIANIAFIIALVRWEERGMRARYGTAFDEYCRRVPQLFPRITPAPSADTAIPSFGDGLRAEVFSLAIFAGLGAIMAAPPQVGWPIFGGLFLLGAFTQPLLARTRGPNR